MLLERFKTDDDSEYRKAVEGRGGDWSQAQEQRAETFNELARINHTLQWAHSDPEQWENYDPPRYQSPREWAEYWAEIEADTFAQEGADADDEFYSDME